MKFIEPTFLYHRLNDALNNFCYDEADELLTNIQEIVIMNLEVIRNEIAYTRKLQQLVEKASVTQLNKLSVVETGQEAP